MSNGLKQGLGIALLMIGACMTAGTAEAHDRYGGHHHHRPYGYGSYGYGYRNRASVRFTYAPRHYNRGYGGGYYGPYRPGYYGGYCR